MYLIDTDIVIWVLRGNLHYTTFIKKLAQKGDLSISTITVAEIYKNIFPSEIAKTEAFLKEITSCDITPPIAKQGGFYWQSYFKKLRNLSLTDCLIAATANVHNLTLVTLNIKHFPMKDIKILNPR